MGGPSPRPGILDIRPYVGGESKIAGMDRIIKLASNESALGPSPAAVEAVQHAAATIHRYPDGGCSDLRAALAESHGLDAERIVCGAGSDELIGLLCRAYCGPGDEVVHTAHGFLMYAIAARTVGATPVAVPETDLTADVDAIAAAVSERTRLVFIANPNNPTGTWLPERAVRRLREALPDHVLLVLDAAYAEYMEDPAYEPGERLVDAYATVVSTRTFSKIYGLGGLRLGWAYCPSAVADVLNRVRNPFNVAAPSQAGGLAALADRGFVDRARAHNAQWRQWLTERLRASGIAVPDSVGNFVLARFPAVSNRDAAAADAFLRGRGIIVRRMGAYGLPDALRITIGTADEMAALADALDGFVGS